MVFLNGIIYSNGDYFIIRTQYPIKRQYRVMTKNRKLHTHVRSMKEAIDLANFAKHKKIPTGSKVDYLISLRRIATDEEMIEKLECLIEIKKNRNQKYFNSQKGVRNK